MKVWDASGNLQVKADGLSTTVVVDDSVIASPKYNITNDTDGLSYTIKCKNTPSGTAVLYLDAGGTVKVINGIPHIWNESDLLWYPITAKNHPTTGIAMLQLGSGIAV